MRGVLILFINLICLVNSFGQLTYKPKNGDKIQLSRWNELWSSTNNNDNLLNWKYFKMAHPDSVPTALITLNNNDIGTFVIYGTISNDSIITIKDVHVLSIIPSTCRYNKSLVIYPNDICTNYYYTVWYDNDDEMYYKRSEEYVDYFIYEVNLMEVRDDGRPVISYRKLWRIDNQNMKLVEINNEEYELEIISPEDQGI